MRTGTLGKLLSLDARGRFGYSGGFGRIAFGYTRLGFYNWFCGIYQKRYYYGKSYISRAKFYRCVNRQTESQQAWRAVFAAGLLAWQALDPETKEQWRLRARGYVMTGFNKFQSEYLKAHRIAHDYSSP